ncbi:MAG: allantoicase [Candidatus Kariarchaeaceae archaeon]|jgi:allantoicase
MGSSLDARFYNLIDLASEQIGGEVIAASDDYFAAKENLIKPGRGEWDPDLFYDRGKVYDGWESRRNRTPEVNDWVIIKLGRSGILRVADIDTNHFLGNAPQFASIEGTDSLNEDPTQTVWTPILQPSALRPGRQNLFHLSHEGEVSYIRLQIYPDGGVARLRLYGETMEEPEGEVDYASSVNGGQAILASDMFFGEMSNLLKSNPPPNMGDGWETKRRRGIGHDWVIIKLGKAISPSRIEVDTTHYKGNFPDYCSIETCFEPELQDHKISSTAKWTTAVENYKLSADTNHVLTDEIRRSDPITHLRLNIFPDGGVARVRVIK